MALQIAYDDLSPSLLLEAAEWYALMLELDDIDALISSSSCPFAFLIGPSRAREVGESAGPLEAAHISGFVPRFARYRRLICAYNRTHYRNFVEFRTAWWSGMYRANHSFGSILIVGP